VHGAFSLTLFPETAMINVTTIPVSSLRLSAPVPALAKERWSVANVEALYALPLMDLLYQAQQVHRAHFDANEVQLSTLLSIKTGGCAEDCAYCPQSAHFDTGVEASKLMPLDEVVAAARAAQAQGATRFCMGAAWRSPKERDIEKVSEMVRAVRDIGLETCMTLGMLDAGQAKALKAAGLDYYNHNLDSSPEFYGRIISTRTYQDRLDTLAHVRDAGIHVCCGGIVGLGETRTQRAGLISQLANLEPYPESVPINSLVQVEGTPLAGTEAIDPVRVRAHHCGGTHHDAAHDGALVGRARADGRSAAGAVLRGRRQLDLLRRQVVDDQQSASRARPCAAAAPGYDGAG
jgi:biotin synthase